MPLLIGPGVSIDWWGEQGDFGVMIVDEASGASAIAVHEVFADALAQASGDVARQIVSASHFNLSSADGVSA